MGNKRITELALRSEVTDDLSIPSDDGLQSYRITGAQLRAFILAAGNVPGTALDASLFSGLTAVTPAGDDYLILTDTSDANKTKKATVGSFVNTPYRSVTATDSVTLSDETMKLSGASFTSTLPTAVGIAGKRFKYIHAGTSLTQVYTLATTSAQTIGGVASGSYALYTNGEVLELESDGANWQIINHRATTDWNNFPYLSAGGTNTTPGNNLISAATTAPTYGNGGTPLINVARWKRVGSRVKIYWHYQQSTAGAAGSGMYTFQLPPGISIDTSLYGVSTQTTPSPTGNPSTVGTFKFSYATAGHGTGQAIPFSATQLKFTEWRINSSSAGADPYWAHSGTAFSVSTLIQFHLDAEFDVPGWQP